MLKLEGVVAVNGDYRVSADFAIEAGARVAVIGPSGAGKSTLLEAVAGFRDLASGRITWAGEEISGLAPGARPVAMLFQDGNLFPQLSAEDNVCLGLSSNRRAGAAEREAARAALERVGLDGLGGRRPGELSGGQQSRVALARVLVQRRDVLLLDEPFSALGPALRAEMLDLVAELVAETGATLMMISHDPDDARRIAPLSVMVAEGRAEGPLGTAALLDDPPDVLREYLG